MLNCVLDNDVITISGEVKVQYLESLGDCLQRGLDSEGAVRLSLAQVTEIDTAGLQALLSFLLTRKEIGPVNIVDSSPVVERALELTGLKQAFSAFAG